MAEDVVVFQRGDLPMQAFPVMEEIRRRGKLCDVTLKVDDQKFSGHRIVLAASIPYFHAMFTHDMVESKQDEITMQGIEPQALEELINYAYNGRIQLDSKNVQSLLVGSSFLHLQDVKEACCDFMKARLHPTNVIATRNFAAQFMCTSLVDSCNKYINKHFVEVSHSPDYLDLEVSDVLDLLGRDELHVENEEQVFEALMLWLLKEPDKRKKQLPLLLTKVRLPLMTPQSLADVVAQDTLVKTSLKCRDLLDEAKDYHLMPERRSQHQTFRTRPRCCSEIVGIIFAVGGLTSSGDSVGTVECFDPIIGRWQIAEPMKTSRSRMGMAVLKGQLYAIGGYDGERRLNTAELFDAESRRWKTVASMICKRSALGVAVLDHKLYVCGGYDGNSSLSSVECYDPTTNMWSMASHMVRHRSAAAVTVLEGQIYVLGGHDGLSIFDSVECYNNVTGSWTETTPMLTKRCRLGAASLNGKIYIAGGYDGNVFLKTVDCFDPITNKWTKVPDMNVKRSRVALVANCGKLYAIGGYDGSANLCSVEVFDPETMTWTLTRSMCAHEGGVGVAVVPLEPAI